MALAIDSSNFETLINGDKLVVIDFWAPGADPAATSDLLSKKWPPNLKARLSSASATPTKTTISPCSSA